MKAIMYEQFGGPEVLQLKEVEKPAIKDTEVLIKVKATSVNYGDLLGRNFRAVNKKSFNMPGILLFFARLDFGFSKPKKGILGSEFSGVVSSVGEKVLKFNVGDEVFGYTGQNMQAYAEYVKIGESGTIALKPKELSFEQAAVLPYGAVTALNLLNSIKPVKGQKILINGASGSIGAAAVQLSKRHFELDVTGVCGTQRAEFVRSLGADKVLDYSKDDFTRNGETYDIIFDILGKSSFRKCKGSLTEKGIYLRASFKTRELWQMLTTKISGGKRVICSLSIDKPEHLDFISQLVKDGKYTSIVDKVFPMDRAVDAHMYAESGERKGSIAIKMNKD